jgi:hypothetical protein
LITEIIEQKRQDPQIDAKGGQSREELLSHHSVNSDTREKPASFTLRRR